MSSLFVPLRILVYYTSMEFLDSGVVVRMRLTSIWVHGEVEHRYESYFHFFINDYGGMARRIENSSYVEWVALRAGV